MKNKFVLNISGGNEACSWTQPYAFETDLSKDDIELRIYEELDRVCALLNNEEFDKIPRVIVIQGEILDNYRDLIYERNGKSTYEKVYIQTLDQYFQSLLTKNNI